MNMTFKIDIDRRKVEAIRCYMPDGNIEELLNEEITKAAENVVNRLYSKTVPKKVQEYLRKSAEIKTDSKKKTEQVNEYRCHKNIWQQSSNRLVYG